MIKYYIWQNDTVPNLVQEAFKSLKRSKLAITTVNYISGNVLFC